MNAAARRDDEVDRAAARPSGSGLGYAERLPRRSRRRFLVPAAAVVAGLGVGGIALAVLQTL